jgi:hypothetical protein
MYPKDMIEYFRGIKSKRLAGFLLFFAPFVYLFISTAFEGNFNDTLTVFAVLLIFAGVVMAFESFHRKQIRELVDLTRYPLKFQDNVLYQIDTDGVDMANIDLTKPFVVLPMYKVHGCGVYEVRQSYQVIRFSDVIENVEILMVNILKFNPNDLKEQLEGQDGEEASPSENSVDDKSAKNDSTAKKSSDKKDKK